MLASLQYLIAATLFSTTLLLAWRWIQRLLDVFSLKPCQDFKSDGLFHPKIESLHDFNWEVEEPLQLRPFKEKFHLTMAIESTTVSKVFQIDKNYFSRLELRKKIISKHPDCIQGNEVVTDAAHELYEFLTTCYLPARFPTMFKLYKGQLINKISKVAYPLHPQKSSRDVLAIIGTLIDEDIMLLLPAEDGDGYTLMGYAVCFASGFALNAMLGKKLCDIHAEVPGYRKRLQLSMERWFEKLQSGTYVRRKNWTVTTHGQLRNEIGENQVYGEDQKQNDERLIDPSAAHLRTELQHLYRLPKSKAIVFSYKTYLYPLVDIKAEGNGHALATAIEGLSKGNIPEIAKYKGATVWGESIVHWLRE